MPDWLSPFFIFLPVYGIFFLGVGIPWALVLLPRDEWRNRPTVLALGLALGPVLGTTWLFALGTWGTLVVERAMTGVILLAVVGVTGAWLRRYTPFRETYIRPEPWSGVEKTLLVMMGLGFVAHIWITMFWPFVQYDTLWTFGYNPRVFFLFERIPDWIDYYPQLVPLTYTYGYLVNGDINDHVAKAAVPWFMFASVMMAYVLGTRVWGRRSIGILTAALWMLIPSALYWSGSGDLEHVMALYFTGAVIFFVLGWRSHNPRYAVISGLLFAGALWTKPTAGSFALGVVLVIALMSLRLILSDSLRQRLNFPAPPADYRAHFRQKFTVAAVSGLACLPIGAMWYVRNLAYGHDAIIFPDSYWNDLAQRSGQEFGWLIVIAILAAGMVGQQVWHTRRRFWMLMLGLALFLLGTLPSALVLDKKWTWHSLWNWTFGARPQDHRLSAAAVLLILAGLGLMLVYLIPAWQKSSERIRSSTLLTALLITPFTMVWFWGYSYHYRLMLTVTPMLAAMVAALLDAWVIPVMSANKLRRRTLNFLCIWLCIPALMVGSYITLWHTFLDPLHNDDEKYAAANPALMQVVAALRAAHEKRLGRDINVYTLGEKRLNFFLPEMRTIDRDSLPTELIQLQDMADVIVGGTHADFLWTVTDVYPNQISAFMDIGFFYSYQGTFLEFQQGSIMGTFFTPILYADDGTNRFIAYEVYSPYRRYSMDELAPPYVFDDPQWAFIALRGLEVRGVIPNDSAPILPDENGQFMINPGDDIYLQLYWQRTDAALSIPENYNVFVHLVDPETGEILSQRDGPLIEGRLPMNLMPYPDVIPDRRYWQLPDDLPSGALNLVIGIYDPLAPDAPPIPLINGDDGFLLEDVFVIMN